MSYFYQSGPAYVPYNKPPMLQSASAVNLMTALNSYGPLASHYPPMNYTTASSGYRTLAMDVQKGGWAGINPVYASKAQCGLTQVTAPTCNVGNSLTSASNNWARS